MKVNAESVFTGTQPLVDDLLGNVEVRRKTARLAGYAIVTSALYGFTMGLGHSPLQASSSAIKVPLLFLLTLSVCLPTLHFIGLLFGSRVAFSHTAVVLLTGITLTSVLLGAFAPISLFFLASGSDYEFLLFLHVLTFAFCGAAGLQSVNKTYGAILHTSNQPSGIAIHLLKVWMFLYMFVGTQTAYNLAPFIERETTFKWFDRAPGNFYTYLWNALVEMAK